MVMNAEKEIGASEITTLWHYTNVFIIIISSSSTCCIPCLQCFDTVGWVAGRASGL